MSQSRPTRFSPSRECPVIDGARQIQRIAVRNAEVGGIPINRALPTRERRTVGAWCFLDHIGPVSGSEIDLHVGAHPHIGLQTFTWMMQGEILHRDSLGTEQIIRPGQVNLMTAGHGIAHTEDSVAGQHAIHAAQLWIALPKEHADTEPSFDHYPDLPRWHEQDMDMTLLIGSYGAQAAPTKSFSPLVGVDLQVVQAGQKNLELQKDFEYGLLPLHGDWKIEGEIFAENDLAYLGCGRTHLLVESPANGRALLVGGAPLKHEVLIWWNFVSHSRAAIMQAQRDWEADNKSRFADVPGATKRLSPPPIPWRE